MSSNGIPLYESGSRINQRSVRPGVWLFAAGSMFLLFVTLLGLSFIEPAAPADVVAFQPTAVPFTFGEPVVAKGTAVNEVVNPTIDPIQTLLTNQQPITLEENGITWQMNPRAQFIIAARIVGNQGYRDWQAAFAPVDLLVAWGEFSNPEVDQWIGWRQSGREGRFHQSSNGSFTTSYILSHVSNIHVIPATKNLEVAIKRLNYDDLILLEGLLVDVNSNRGNIKTSLTRTDSGEGACEILYVRRLVMEGMEYR